MVKIGQSLTFYLCGFPVLHSTVSRLFNVFSEVEYIWTVSKSYLISVSCLQENLAALCSRGYWGDASFKEHASKRVLLCVEVLLEYWWCTSPHYYTLLCVKKLRRGYNDEERLLNPRYTYMGLCLVTSGQGLRSSWLPCEVILII